MSRFRIGVVGAASLRGKELSEELGDSSLGASEFVLLDEDDAVGQVTAAADEVSIILPVQADSFAHMDFVFFSGEAGVTRRYWQDARRAGASIVDMTYALEAEKEVLISAPWVNEDLSGSKGYQPCEPDLKTPAVVPAHPAALMLALVAARVQKIDRLKTVAATVMEPASEYGAATMDELHQQTVKLLSFQTLPRDQYDAQVSFNLLPSLGAAAQIKLSATEQRIRRHYTELTQGLLPQLAVQLIQAPVFHGYAISLLVEFAGAMTVEQVEGALAGEHVEVTRGESEPPSNVNSAGRKDILVQVRKEPDSPAQGSRFWLWMSADNLKLAAANAIACAAELRRLRPHGKVQ